MKLDRFLIAILIAITLLVALAIGLFFLRQGDQNYSSEDAPSGVVHNYILALQKKDFQRAYNYLQDATSKPDFNQFRAAFVSHQLDISSVAVQLGDTNQTGQDASVDLVVVHNNNGPFGNPFRETGSALLTQNGTGAWKITRLPFPYWGWEWFPKPVGPAPTAP